MIYPAITRKRIFEEEGSEVLPPSNRQFKMKEQVTRKATEKENLRKDPSKDALRDPAVSDAEAIQKTHSSPDGV